ncbi:MAG: N-acetylornithine carbamoyltransferase [Pseudomonadota bacterium]
MRHFLSTEPLSKAEIQGLLDDARALKEAPQNDALRGTRCALIFFNPSLRTRTSFQVGIADLGGTSVVLDAAGTWPMEVEPGAIMSDVAEEHVSEAARVLSSYVDLIAIRSFPKFENWKAEREDPVLNGFVKHATVPVINMETIIHPCQELAMLMALQDRHGSLEGKKFLLTWTWHPQPLNTAVANSALLAATKMGMDVTLLCPSQDYLLDPMFMEAGEAFAQENGRALNVTHDIDEAYTGADAVYAKSWGRLDQIGLPMEQRLTPEAFSHFIVNEEKMAKTNNATFSHCLPLRRNVKATDAVIDGPNSLIYPEAENRLHVQKAVLSALIGS